MSTIGTRLSIEHELKGFTLTLTTPAIAAVEALHVGRRALAAHGCSSLLVAAAEDVPGAYTGQGAVALLLESGTGGGRGGYGVCRSSVLFLSPRSLADAASRAHAVRLVRRALDELDAGPDIPVYLVADGSAVARVVTEALNAGTLNAGTLNVGVLHAGRYRDAGTHPGFAGSAAARRRAARGGLPKWRRGGRFRPPRPSRSSG